MYENKVIKLSYKILEFIAQNKYLSKTLAIYFFPDYSQSHIEKTLKNLFDCKLLQRKMIENEPIRSSREYVYYLSKKGAQKVLLVSHKFAEVEDMNAGSGNINFVYHDLCVAWIAAMWKKQSIEYQGVLFDEIATETRRNFLHYDNIIPDVNITSKKNEKAFHYYVEVDNFTVSSKEWRKRCFNYIDHVKENVYLLIVLTKYNPKRLHKLMTIANNVIPKCENIFGTSIKEMYHCSYVANIWLGKQNIDLEDNNLAMYLPL